MCIVPFSDISSAFIVGVTPVTTRLALAFATFAWSSTSFVAFYTLSCPEDRVWLVSELALHGTSGLPVITRSK